MFIFREINFQSDAKIFRALWGISKQYLLRQTRPSEAMASQNFVFLASIVFIDNRINYNL